MSIFLRRLLFAMFFISGFCSLLYQIVWVRLAFASFGVVSPVISVVVSVFMLGLGVGSWGASSLAAAWQRRTRRSAMQLYALAECIIGIGAFATPLFFRWGEQLLMATGEMHSAPYLVLSAVVIALSIFPWCLCMGATFPLMMAFVREEDQCQTSSFSFLYLANVCGALSGAAVTSFVLVELLGFQRTLVVAASGNLLIAITGLLVGRARRVAQVATVAADTNRQSADRTNGRLVPAVLFFTGFCSMALEIVWTRAFTPVIGTQVYSFASLLFAYLAATFVGSQRYRRDLSSGRPLETGSLLAWLTVVGLIQIVLQDPRLLRILVDGLVSNLSLPTDLTSPLIVFGLLATIAPFCGLLGYLTPKLIDEWSAGDPHRAGRAYAVNVWGCILGPLAASYLLLPSLGIKWTMIALTVPLAPLAWVAAARRISIVMIVNGCIALLAAVFWATSYEEWFADDGAIVRRDYTATVVTLSRGRDSRMLVNGIGMTSITPITKMMAHLPLAHLERRPESALVICFGMGTTYRSLLSWNIDATAVELVPSVRDAFVDFYPDADALMHGPHGRIIVDDGRRYLNRTRHRFDVITLDPPPPVEAAGSSLLYSQELYQLVKQHLAEDGILQQWFPGHDLATFGAVTRTLRQEFPHVRVFLSHEGWGFHFLCSRRPLPDLSVDTMIQRMPEAAKRDLLELAEDGESLAQMLAKTLGRSELSPAAQAAIAESNATITDDRPFNEYFVMRRLFARWNAESRLVTAVVP